MRRSGLTKRPLDRPWQATRLPVSGGDISNDGGSVLLTAAQVATLQRDLIKLGERVRETARRVWLGFASGCPVQDLWPDLLLRLQPPPDPKPAARFMNNAG